MQQTQSPNDAIQQSFDRWLERNPHIYSQIKNLALKIVKAGHTKYAIKTLVEVARWHFDLKKSGKEKWLISNSYTSRMARKLMDEEPQLTGLFELKPLRAT